MAVINPYMHFNGNTKEAFTFYKSVFGGAFAKKIRYKELPSAEHRIAENDANRLMHIALPIGKTNMLLGSDVMKILGQVTETDNKNTISISAESREEADKLFNGLSAGGNCFALRLYYSAIFSQIHKQFYEDMRKRKTL